MFLFNQLTDSEVISWQMTALVGFVVCVMVFLTTDNRLKNKGLDKLLKLVMVIVVIAGLLSGFFYPSLLRYIGGAFSFFGGLLLLLYERVDARSNRSSTYFWRGVLQRKGWLALSGSGVWMISSSFWQPFNLSLLLIGILLVLIPLIIVLIRDRLGLL
jgi:hypothetical protein